MEEIEKPIFDSFDIDAQLLPATNNEDEKMKAIRALLIRRIEELAEKDMEKLMWILYRVDVSEKKLHNALQGSTPESFAPVIADLIIERQIQKANTRKQFGESENDWNFDV
ncbi:MAG TPA: hypothetical protein VG603_15720 [Chitinophagales bacterium]|nr:hypothetical protein [Chitinophagales bacterium]